MPSQLLKVSAMFNMPMNNCVAGATPQLFIEPYNAVFFNQKSRNLVESTQENRVPFLICLTLSILLGKNYYFENIPTVNITMS
jgi:hypothetical protein